jgi:hypothetical protein
MLYPAQMEFSNALPVLLELDTRVPTNSQATIWSSWLFPLLYRPATVSFRMTDIWRGYIIQAALQHFRGISVFGKLGFVQNRNEHNLLRDFESEVSGHLFGERVYEIALSSWQALSQERTTQNLLFGLVAIYSALCEEGIVNVLELEILDAWVEAFNIGKL